MPLTAEAPGRSVAGMWKEGMDVDGGERVRRSEPMFDLPLPLVAIVLALLGIHLLREFLPAMDDLMLLARFAFVPDRYLLENGAPTYPGGWAALAWTFVTYAGLHGSWMHVGLNAVMLAAVGRVVLLRIGTARFLGLFLVSAVAGAAVHLAFDWGSQAPMIGASGVVFGVMGASLRFVFAPHPWRVPSALDALRQPRVRGFVLALVLMNLVLVVFGSAPFGGGDGGTVAWTAHLGGFLAGFFGFSLFDRPFGR